MKKIIYLLLIILAYTFPVSSQTPLTGKELSAAVATLNKTSSQLKSLQCDFTQTKHLKMLKDKMISKGKMYYSSPDKLRWEYTSPYQYIFIFNGTKVYIKNKGTQNVIDTKSNKIFKEVARIMMQTVTGKALSNSEDFSVSISKDSKSYQVILTPKKKDLKQLFYKVRLNFSQTSKLITEIRLDEKNGDYTVISMTNTKIDIPLNAKLFSL